ncbi:HlyD family secretion protein [uncultured Cohaesibacter sp.]|uniref:HlyD family secretion protein n=1 Tax=uncultured Cohaesibacter sp. TaxID=1002546 RepID=UPI00292CAF6A|nr:HlyD family secretion protein [uncultured Cohaesibacter sp.]
MSGNSPNMSNEDDNMTQETSGSPVLVKADNDENAAAAKPSPKRNPFRLILMMIVPLALLLAGGWVWLTGGRFEETDNAYAQQAVVSISADVSGRILSVDVSENQPVKAGDTLFSLDPEPFEIAIDQAQASLNKVRLDVEQLKVNHLTAITSLETARSALNIQQELYNRKEILAEKGVSSSSSLDELKLSLVQAKSAVTSAEKQVENALAALGGQANIETDAHPLVRAALANLRLAKRNLEKSIVKAPADGIVSQIDNINTGQYVAAGSEMAMLFEVSDSWVDANFKETQLENIRIGMPVEVIFDAYPKKSFKGKIASISSGTGAEFSLIPAQNATGNWVKVVQRVPIRIEFESSESTDLIRAGLSAAVSVDTGSSTWDRL